MPYVEGYAKVRVWVPPQQQPGGPDQGLPGEPDYPDQGLPPGFPGAPDQGLPPSYPGRPGQGLPWPGRPVDPGWGVDEGSSPGQGLPGWPGRPDQGLPRPPREHGPYPIVPTDDVGGHPELPDLNMPGRWGTVTKGRSGHQGWPAWIVDPHREPPQVEEDYEQRHPTSGVPGEWVTVLYQGAIAWAWVPDIEDTSGPEHPDHGEPEVDPLRR